MISYEDAVRLIRKVGTSNLVESEMVADITQWVGRVCAGDVSSPECVPSFDNSAMDGFALRAVLTENASESRPVQIPVIASTAAGDAPALEAQRPNAAWEIMTGAPMPAGYDTVVKIEDVKVQVDSDGRAVGITVGAPAKPGKNVREAGEDFKQGSVVAQAGNVIGPEHIMAFTALGITTLRLGRKPRVAVISTGRELVSGSDALKPGQIRNSTAPYLMEALRLLGVSPKFWGTIEDEPAKFESLMQNVLEDEPDVVITTGAVSMGRYDFIKDSLEKLGATSHFHKVAIRPGKPVLFGELHCSGRAKPVAFFGLPGNPVSTAAGLRFFVEPYLRAVVGLKPEIPRRLNVTETVWKPSGLRCFFKARILPDNVSVEILKGQASFMISPLLEANAWAILSEEGDKVLAGTAIDVVPLVSDPVREKYL